MQQRYVSNELTHFAGRRAQTHPEQYQILRTILRQGRLGTGTTDGYEMSVDGSQRPTTNEMVQFPMVCFCDIPFADLHLHMKKYSQFGLAFRKSTLIGLGARPVYYVPKDGPTRFTFIRDIVNSMGSLGVHTAPDRPVINPPDVANLVAHLDRSFHDLAMHVFGYMKFFESASSDSDEENYYMEREWRVPNMVEFTLGMVSRVILPKEYCGQFRGEFPDYLGQLDFPA